ncbi:MAG: hypothetical protein ACRERV_07355 [Methylococcales bacterium]
MNRKILVITFVAVFGLVGVQSTAIAEECPDRNHYNEQTNAKFLEEGIALSEEALEHAKQGHGAEAKKATKAALSKLHCMISTTGGSQLQGPRGKILTGGVKAGKGDMEAAIPLLEQGIALLKEVNMTPKGLGDD